MLLLTKEDIKKVFTMKDAIDAVKTAFKLYSEGKSVVPLRTNIDVPKFQGQSLFMPGYVEDLNSLGIKIVSVFPKNAQKNIPSVPAKMILLDGTTGDVCCIMDGTYLTQLRTGAGSGAATDILSNKDSKIGALIGTGGQARCQLEAMLSVRELEEVRVYSLEYEKSCEFAENMQRELKEYNARIIPVKSSDEAVCDADIITAVTTSKSPVFDGKKVKKGAHINGVGSYTPNMQEMDEYIVSKAEGFYVDSKEAVLSEAGDIIIPINKGVITKDRIDGEIGELLTGKIKGRRSKEDITIYKTVGISVMDIVTAYKIYDKALQMGIGVFADI
ncbi:ornithine cyclodeaminase family protein [Caloramator sp. E03]|uniref:ornithine cyclodeaminase family protein n=1 Tax=Caloramator sp. E03 TaxID=2576307 RepID=UPI00111046EA|nr:ornithine cyclodeaminase family protein [Caloramator sp. E03]QCX32766.1 ornithine cyclodeaminase family protein [Caloramator sp. E03]